MIVHRAELVIVNPTLAPGVGHQAFMAPAPVPHPAPELAGIVTKLGRLRRELGIWAAAGAKLAPKPVRRERLTICAGCEYYAATGNLGLGECRWPGCGCTRVKAALATSQCPHKPPKWLAWAPAKAALAES